MKRLPILLCAALLVCTASLHAFGIEREYPIANAQIVQWSSRSGIAACSDKTLFAIKWIKGKDTTYSAQLHKAPITALCWSADDSLTATGDTGGTVVIATSGPIQQRLSISGDYGKATAVAFDTEKARIAIGYSDGTLRICSATSGKTLLLQQEPNNAVTAIMWKPTQLFAGREKGYALYNGQSYKVEDTKPTDAAVTACAFWSNAKADTTLWAIGLENGAALLHKTMPFGAQASTPISTGNSAPVLAVNFVQAEKTIGFATHKGISFVSTDDAQWRDEFDLPGNALSVAIEPQQTQRVLFSTAYKVILYDLSMATHTPDPLAARHSIKAYPNPATDVLTVEVQSKYSHAESLVLVDGVGRECAVLARDTRQEGTRIYSVDVHSLPAGLYHLVLSTEKEKQIIPITIVH